MEVFPQRYTQKEASISLIVIRLHVIYVLTQQMRVIFVPALVDINWWPLAASVACT